MAPVVRTLVAVGMAVVAGCGAAGGVRADDAATAPTPAGSSSGSSAAFATDVDETTRAVAQGWACGIEPSAAADAGGRVVCWGTLPPGVSDVPTEPFLQVSAGGDSYVCGVTTQLRLKCWGDAVPYGVAALAATRVVQVSAASGYACAVAHAGSLACFGACPGRAYILFAFVSGSCTPHPSHTHTHATHTQVTT